MSLYHDVLNPELASQLDEHLNKLLPEQLSLAEEVGLHKILCKDAVKNWAEARELRRHAKTDEDQAMAATLTQAAGDTMAEAFKRHATLTQSAANTDGRMREILTASTLVHYIRSVLTLVNTKYNDGTPQGLLEMESFETELRECITIREASTEQLTVESQFGSMVNSVPKPIDSRLEED